MNSRRHLVLGCALILSALSMSGCVPATDTDVGLPNPAAVHCEDQGYTYEIRTAEDGSQYGVCIFPDGSECDGWAYLRGNYSGMSLRGAKRRSNPRLCKQEIASLRSQ